MTVKTPAPMKTCADFGSESDCCEACHYFEDKRGGELAIIRRADGSPFARVCCEIFEDAMAAMRREEANSN
jgi:hypothetical protein